MAVGFSNTNKPINPRGLDASPKGYNRAALYSGKALDFDGVNDEVNIGAVSGTFSNLSMSWYIKTTYTADFQCLFADGAGNFDVYVRPDKKLHVWTGSQQSFYEIPDIQTGEWVNLVLVKDGANASLYYNGQLAQTIAFSGSSFSISNGFVGIGLNSLYDYNGEMAGFKIFNTALTAAQVSDLYNNPEKIVPTGVEDTALKLWLPMMEGAGTTAYDGSGNGNHGTISGATYVNGVGSPVAQSAVIDWNKGTNNQTYSEQANNAQWTQENLTISNNVETAPNGTLTADKMVASAVNTFHFSGQAQSLPNAKNYTASIYAKAAEYEHLYICLRTDTNSNRYGVKFDLTNGTFVDDAGLGTPTQTGYNITSVGDGWYRCEVTSYHTSGDVNGLYGPSPGGNVNGINNTFAGNDVNGIYVWGAQVNEGTTATIYVPTIGTLQPNPVLLPQGLTSGRDITGVNLFENVRKQGALNLDGNSWAEVHDNASVDLTDGLTLEAWVYSSASDPTAGEGIISKWHESSGNRSYLMYALDYDTFYFFLSNDGTATNNISWSLDSGELEQYNHFVCTFDGSSFKAYKNGSLATNGTTTFSTLKQSDKNVAISNFNVGQGQQRKYSNSIAQPRIYNRALTAEEVLRNYNSGKSTYQ